MGYLIEGPHNWDYSILGSILGSPILGNYHISNTKQHGETCREAAADLHKPGICKLVPTFHLAKHYAEMLKQGNPSCSSL